MEKQMSGMKKNQKVFSGEIKVINFDGLKEQDIFKCNFKIKPNMTRYSNTNGYNSQLFNIIKHDLDIMLSSYYKGMLLDKNIYTWVDKSENTALNSWLSNKKII